MDRTVVSSVEMRTGEENTLDDAAVDEGDTVISTVLVRVNGTDEETASVTVTAGGATPLTVTVAGLA
jgi:hypothetical protein